MCNTRTYTEGINISARTCEIETETGTGTEKEQRVGVQHPTRNIQSIKCINASNRPPQSILPEKLTSWLQS